jgi:hypothetical protein
VVSDQFHEFFLGTAGVAGALIGLLFVAISVTPAAASGRAGHVYQQVRAAAAMSMFIDALVVSLLALLPGQYLGNGSTALAVAGITSTVALVITFARTHDSSRTFWSSARTLVLFAAVLVIYGFQLASALHLNGSAADNGEVAEQGTLVVIMFLMGIARAWEIVGATKLRVLDVLAHESRPAAPSPDGAASTGRSPAGGAPAGEHAS